MNSLRREIADRLAGVYGHRLEGVYLYGSYARGDADEESDVDFLVVLDEFSSYGAEVDHTSELASGLSLKYAVSISLVFLRKREWTAAESPFVRNVRDEAVAA